LISLFAGGDYDDGILGCGVETAHALAKCGYGDQLLAAVQNMNDNNLKEFLICWRESIQDELSSNSQGHLSSRQPFLATKIDDTFPKKLVLNLYVNPVTSWSFPQNIPDKTLWRLKEPDIPNLVQFCAEKFNWNTEAVLKDKFQKYLWEGVFLQMLYSASLSSPGYLFEFSLISSIK